MNMFHFILVLILSLTLFGSANIETQIGPDILIEERIDLYQIISPFSKTRIKVLEISQSRKISAENLLSPTHPALQSYLPEKPLQVPFFLLKTLNEHLGDFDKSRHGNKVFFKALTPEAPFLKASLDEEKRTAIFTLFIPHSEKFYSPVYTTAPASSLSGPTSGGSGLQETGKPLAKWYKNIHIHESYSMGKNGKIYPSHIKTGYEFSQNGNSYYLLWTLHFRQFGWFPKNLQKIQMLTPPLREGRAIQKYNQSEQAENSVSSYTQKMEIFE